MFHMLAVIALAATASSTPCPAVSVSQDAVEESLAMAVADVAQELVLEEATQIAEQEFAARVAELGLTGAAPLFGTVPDQIPARNTRLARRADARGPRR